MRENVALDIVQKINIVQSFYSQRLKETTEHCFNRFEDIDRDICIY